VAPYLGRAVAEAQRLGMAVRVGERTLGPAAAELFAGIGEVEAPPPAEEAAARKKVSLPVASDHHGPAGDAREADEEHA
jgi:hypothetical protein